MKRIIYLSLILFLAGFGCEPEPAQEPFFKDAELITITGTGTTLTFEMPDVEYKYIVVGCFGGTPAIDENNKLITPPASGIRTGMADFFIGNIAYSTPTFNNYIVSSGDFTGTAVIPSGNGLIWAYDKDYNLVASSGVFTY